MSVNISLSSIQQTPVLSLSLSATQDPSRGARISREPLIPLLLFICEESAERVGDVVETTQASWWQSHKKPKGEYSPFPQKNLILQCQPWYCVGDCHLQQSKNCAENTTEEGQRQMNAKKCCLEVGTWLLHSGTRSHDGYLHKVVSNSRVAHEDPSALAEELGSSRLLGKAGLFFLGIVAPCRLPMCTQITLIRGNNMMAGGPHVGGNHGE